MTRNFSRAQILLATRAVFAGAAVQEQQKTISALSRKVEALERQNAVN